MRKRERRIHTLDRWFRGSVARGRVIKAKTTNGGQDECDDSRCECPWDQSRVPGLYVTAVSKGYPEQRDVKCVF